MGRILDDNFWKNVEDEEVKKKDWGRVAYTVKYGDTLSQIAQDIHKARQLKEHISYIEKYLVEENNIPKYDGDYFLEEGKELNVGVLHRTSYPYILYLDVTDKVTRFVDDCVREAKDMSLWTWATKKVNTGGDWDVKAHTKHLDGLFHKNKFRGQYSQYFRMNDWGYNPERILRYDDVGNINYGATGRHLSEDTVLPSVTENGHTYFRTDRIIDYKILIKEGGLYQKLTDSSNYFERKLYWLKMGINSLGLFKLDSNNLASSDQILNEEIRKHVENINDHIYETKKGLRNDVGDDPRDSYAITWGYEKFR